MIIAEITEVEAIEVPSDIGRRRSLERFVGMAWRVTMRVFDDAAPETTLYLDTFEVTEHADEERVLSEAQRRARAWQRSQAYRSDIRELVGRRIELSQPELNSEQAISPERSE